MSFVICHLSFVITMGKLKNLFNSIKESRHYDWFLLGVASLSFIACFLITFFSARYIFDCVTADRTVHIEERNTLTYSVHFTKPKDGEMSWPRGNFSYPREDFKEIKIENRYSATLTAAIPIEYSYSYYAELNVYRGAKGSTPPLGPTIIYNDLKPTKRGSSPNGHIDVSDDFSFDFDKFYADMKKRAMEFGENESNVTGEIVLTFTAGLTNIATGGKTAPMRSNVTLLLNNDNKFTVAVSGKETQSTDIPERNAHFPDFSQTVLMALGIGGTMAVMIVALRQLFREQDEYRRTVKKIQRKYGSDVVKASMQPDVEGLKRIDLNDFEDILKFSLNLGKPVVRYDTEESTVYYIICDDYIYMHTVYRSLYDLQGLAEAGSSAAGENSDDF